jgi:hypothetical protein
MARPSIASEPATITREVFRAATGADVGADERLHVETIVTANDRLDAFTDELRFRATSRLGQPRKSLGNWFWEFHCL